MSKEDNVLYKTSLESHALDPERQQLSVYVPRECSNKGYIKIYLLYNFYQYLRKNYLQAKIKQIGSSGLTIQQLLHDMAADKSHRTYARMNTRLSELSGRLRWTQTKIRMNARMIPDVRVILKQILDLNLYVCVLLKSQVQHEGEPHGGHAVMLVGMDRINYQIKNTWHDGRIILSRVDNLQVDLPLRSGRVRNYNIKGFNLLLPISLDMEAIAPEYDERNIKSLIDWIGRYRTIAQSFIPPEFIRDRVSEAGASGQGASAEGGTTRRKTKTKRQRQNKQKRSTKRFKQQKTKKYKRV